MVYLGPLQRIVNVHWGEAEPEYYYMLSGISGDGLQRGVGAGLLIGGTTQSSMHLQYAKPDDPAWVAVCNVLVTLHSPESSPQMQISWTGFFTDGRAGDPNDVGSWLDGLLLTIAGYGDLPALAPPGSAFLGLSRTTYNGFFTSYVWVNFPDTGAITPFPVSPDTTEESRFQITYPGWDTTE